MSCLSLMGKRPELRPSNGQGGALNRFLRKYCYIIDHQVHNLQSSPDEDNLPCA